MCRLYPFPMAHTPRILAFSGSARKESLNRKLLAVTVQALRDAGAVVNVLDLNEFELPLYHGDLEDQRGLPPVAAKLIELITSHRGLLIASPEYNSFPTPLLKNTIDWCTRGEDNPFVGRAAAVVSASPGVFGGVRSNQHVRHLLLHLGCHVVPGTVTLPRAPDAFDDAGGLQDERARKAVAALASGLVDLVRRLDA